jgi:hypothetical protein
MFSGRSKLVAMSNISAQKPDVEDYRFREVARKADGSCFVWGPVMIPVEIDVQDEAPRPDPETGDSAAEIEAAAHEWFKSGRTQVDEGHSYQDIPGVVPVESVIVRWDTPGMRRGSWWAGADVTDREIAEKIDKGEINGWSWAGPYSKQTFLTLVSHAIEASGFTEKSDHGPYPEHDHEVPKLEFQNNGRVKPTRTAFSWGHDHGLAGTTRTEPTEGHSHPMRIEPMESDNPES